MKIGMQQIAVVCFRQIFKCFQMMMMIDKRVLVGDHYALCHVVALGLYAALFCTAATTAAAKAGARVQ